MACIDSITKDTYALYNGDSCQILPDFPVDSIGLSVYSPPFGGLYHYSSSDEDLSNAPDYETFFQHFDFIVKELFRITKPGRMTCVHAMDVPLRGDHGIKDFTGDIIRQHERLGWEYWARFDIWKEPLKVAILTRAKTLTHQQLVKDSCLSANAGSDYLLVFRKPGHNSEPVAHPQGLTKYAGSTEIPSRLKSHPDPKLNRPSQWIWRQYASSFWHDIRINRVLSYKKARESDEEKHCHPLQLDVIERCVIMWSNPNDIVLTPFMGVGSEVYGALINGRRGIGIELKQSYYRQAVRNLMNVEKDKDQVELFSFDENDFADDATDELPE